VVSVAVYVIGAPGAGKTSLVAELVGAPTPGTLIDVLDADWEQHEAPVPHVSYPSGWTEVGRRRGAFSGTDALSYSIAPAAAAWVRSPGRPDRLVGEGDRLATDGFLAALSASYDRLVVALVDVAPAVSYDRMVARAESLGRRPQSLAWWKGRCTKTARLADRWDALRLDGSRPPADLASQINLGISSPNPRHPRQSRV
jgi:hypothetical protein